MMPSRCGSAIDLLDQFDAHRKEHRFKEDSILFISITALVFVSRIPFLGPGYGLQPDAWRVALAAHRIATTGEYSVSRFPGFPVQEIASAVFWAGGPWALNGITALLSGVGAAFLALSLKALGRKDHTIAGLALAFIPVVYIYSTMPLDSVWAVALILGSLYAVLLRRPMLAGVLLGLAVGCRITSGAMLLPLGLFLVAGHRRGALREMSQFASWTAVVAAAAYWPVVATYGWRFFTFSEGFGYPPWRDVVRQATLEVWGSLGSLGVLVAMVALVLRATAFRTIRFRFLSDEGLQVTACILTMSLYTIAYLRLPHQPKYLMPLLPFAILLLNLLLDRRVFLFVCSMFIAAPFVTVGRSGIHPGPVFSSHYARQRDMAFIEQVVSAANRLNERVTVVAGSWQPKIEGVLLGRPPALADYVYGLDAATFARRGRPVYYLPGVSEYNRALTGADLAGLGAKPLLSDGPEEERAGESRRVRAEPVVLPLARGRVGSAEE
jgi:hypothetical protein